MKALFNIKESRSNKTRLLYKQQKIVQLFVKKGNDLTIDEISTSLKISMPTGLKLVNELLNRDILEISGKKKTANGRKPLLYSLKSLNLFVISVEILLNHVAVGILDRDLNTIYYQINKKFVLKNSQKSLDELTEFMNECIHNSGISNDQLLGIGIGMTGRVNKNGDSLNYYTFLDQSFADYMAQEFSLLTVLNNDTRCFGQAERGIGKAKGISNAIVINLSGGLGTSLILNDEIVDGGEGYAGEFGHMQFGNSNKMCICGKRGCLGGEVSGFALKEKFKDAVTLGEQSILVNEKSLDQIGYEDILISATQGDLLAIQQIQGIGLQLGEALGNLLNLLNPEKIIIGGKFTIVKEIIEASIKTGLMNTSLIGPLKYCSLEFSDVGDHTGLKGAGAFVYKHFKLL